MGVFTKASAAVGTVLVCLPIVATIVSLAVGARSPERPAGSLAAYGPLPAQSASALVLGEGTALTQTHYLFLPLIYGPPEEPPPWIDPSNRQVSLDYFNQVYRASEGVAIGWTGDHASCDAGETTLAFREAVKLRINYFRAMAGVPGNVQLAGEYSSKAQQAALMMSVNGQLSHDPPPSWLCYTDEGAEAAGSSNLYLGVYGPSAITGYMYDPGSGNYAVGHRR